MNFQSFLQSHWIGRPWSWAGGWGGNWARAAGLWKLNFTSGFGSGPVSVSVRMSEEGVRPGQEVQGCVGKLLCPERLCQYPPTTSNQTLLDCFTKLLPVSTHLERRVQEIWIKLHFLYSWVSVLDSFSDSYSYPCTLEEKYTMMFFKD